MSSERERRTDKARGQVYAAMIEHSRATGSAMPSFETKDVMASLDDEASHINSELNGLDMDERKLLDELCGIFTRRQKNDDAAKAKEIFRAREIIEQLEMNVNFPALPYGETFLNMAIRHSFDMVTLLIEKGADVNQESQIGSETALDNLLECEDCNGLSGEMKKMKELLLAKGAKTQEERLMAAVEEIRGVVTRHFRAPHDVN